MAINTKQLLGESTMIGVMGRRRQGKTLLAAYLCAQAAKLGVRVLHNGPLKFGEKVSLDELV